MTRLKPIRRPKKPIEDPVKLLKWVRKLYEDERRWTQQADFRDRSGKEIDPFVEHARGVYSACLSGALDFGGNWKAKFYASEALYPSCGDHYVAWNDSPRRTIAQVRRLLDRAIAKLEAGQ